MPRGDRKRAVDILKDKVPELVGKEGERLAYDVAAQRNAKYCDQHVALSPVIPSIATAPGMSIADLEQALDASAEGLLL